MRDFLLHLKQEQKTYYLWILQFSDLITSYLLFLLLFFVVLGVFFRGGFLGVFFIIIIVPSVMGHLLLPLSYQSEVQWIVDKHIIQALLYKLVYDISVMRTLKSFNGNLLVL